MIGWNSTAAISASSDLVPSMVRCGTTLLLSPWSRDQSLPSMGVLWNGGGLRLGELHIPVVFLDSLLHKSVGFADADLPALKLNLVDYAVVSRQFGYDGALTAPADAAFGQGVGQIWLTYVQCVGDETSIFECNHGGWGIHNCGYNNDASAVCRLPGKITVHKELVHV